MSQKVKEGTVVKVHYVGKYDDGNEFDNSYKSNRPIVFEVGKNQMIHGFESAVINRDINEKFNVKIPSDQAYGEYSDELVKEIPKQQLGLPDEQLSIGTQIQGTTPDNQHFICTLKEIKGDTAYLDLNHPLAGKDLNFEIEILEIVEN